FDIESSSPQSFFQLFLPSLAHAETGEEVPPPIVSPEVVVETTPSPAPHENVVEESPPSLPTPKEEVVPPSVTVEDKTPQAVPPETVNDPNVTSSSEPVPIGPPIIASLENSSDTITTSVSSSSATSSSFPLPEPPPPDDRFLILSYSIDGQNWFELKRIGMNDWRNLTVDLPVRSWGDLKNVQIKITGTPSTLQVIPPVFLDGILVEVTSRMFQLPDFGTSISSSQIEFLPFGIQDLPRDEHASSSQDYFLQFRDGEGTVPEVETLFLDWCGALSKEALSRVAPEFCVGGGRVPLFLETQEDGSFVMRTNPTEPSYVAYTIFEEGKKLKMRVAVSQSDWQDLNQPFFIKMVLDYDERFSALQLGEDLIFDEGKIVIGKSEGGTLIETLANEPHPSRPGRAMKSFIFQLEKKETDPIGEFTIELWKV
ncbi:MAG: hypothetical protein AAB691_04530, partial [Patescibacteria group bacterium]